MLSKMQRLGFKARRVQLFEAVNTSRNILQIELAGVTGISGTGAGFMVCVVSLAVVFAQSLYFPHHLPGIA